MKQSLKIELQTKDELKKSIKQLLKASKLDQAAFINLAPLGAKRVLMERWNKEASKTRLELQRVLRIVRELERSHG